MLRSGLSWVVLDSKHDPGFDRYEPSKRLLTMDALGRAWRAGQRIAVSRPSPRQNVPALLDAYLEDIHESWDGVGVCVDETYQLVDASAQPGPGLTGLCTRGRVRHQAVICGAQRPKRVPVFCYSEANFLAVLDLTLRQDRKALYDNVGMPQLMDARDPRHWLWVDVGDKSAAGYGPVAIGAPSQPGV
jgi:hypothetical protein